MSFRPYDQSPSGKVFQPRYLAPVNIYKLASISQDGYVFVATPDAEPDLLDMMTDDRFFEDLNLLTFVHSSSLELFNKLTHKLAHTDTRKLMRLAAFMGKNRKSRATIRTPSQGARAVKAPGIIKYEQKVEAVVAAVEEFVDFNQKHALMDRIDALYLYGEALLSKYTSGTRIVEAHRNGPSLRDREIPKDLPAKQKQALEQLENKVEFVLSKRVANEMKRMLELIKSIGSIRPSEYAHLVLALSHANTGLYTALRTIEDVIKEAKVKISKDKLDMLRKPSLLFVEKTASLDHIKKLLPEAVISAFRDFQGGPRAHLFPVGKMFETAINTQDVPDYEILRVVSWVNSCNKPDVQEFFRSVISPVFVATPRTPGVYRSEILNQSLRISDKLLGAGCGADITKVWAEIQGLSKGTLIPKKITELGLKRMMYCRADMLLHAFDECMMIDPNFLSKSRGLLPFVMSELACPFGTSIRRVKAGPGRDKQDSQLDVAFDMEEFLELSGQKLNSLKVTFLSCMMTFWLNASPNTPVFSLVTDVSEDTARQKGSKDRAYWLCQTDPKADSFIQEQLLTRLPADLAAQATKEAFLIKLGPIAREEYPGLRSDWGMKLRESNSFGMDVPV